MVYWLKSQDGQINVSMILEQAQRVHLLVVYDNGIIRWLKELNQPSTGHHCMAEVACFFSCHEENIEQAVKLNVFTMPSNLKS